jgi:hypothetical protein
VELAGYYNNFYYYRKSMSTVFGEEIMKAKGDEWGGIDPGIERLVYALNTLGIPTSGSCEGHIDRGYPSPWVSVRTVRDSQGGDEDGGLQKRAQTFLKKFYAARNVPQNIKISIMKSNGGFWIHAESEKFKMYREMFNAQAAERNSGGILNDIHLSDAEKARRATSIPLLQSEFDAFGNFLESQYIDNT